MGRDCRRFYAPLAVLPLAVAAFLFPPPVADLFLVPLASLDAQPDDDTADDEGVEEDWDDEMIDDDVVGEFLIDDDVILQPPPQAQVEQIERGLRLRVRAELEFVRMTCAPTDAQILELNHAGDQFVADVVAGIRTNPPRRIEPSVMFADRASPCLCDLQPVIHALLDTARRVKYLDELSRTDELIRQAHILDRVATLDETYLLTAEQRDELGRILDARWANPNRSEVVGAHHVNSPVDANAWFVHQLTPLPELPKVFLKMVLRPRQYQVSQSSTTLEIPAERTVVHPATHPVDDDGNDQDGDNQDGDAPADDDLPEELDEPIGDTLLPDVETYSAAEGVALLEALLNQTLDEMDAAAGLDDSQRRKLAMAGMIDIRQYVGRLAGLERRMIDAQQNHDHRLAAEPDELRLLQTPTSAITDDSSAFRKLLAKTLSPQQAQEFAAVERERREFAADALRRRAIAELSESVPLTPAQWTGLLKLLEEDGEPGNRPSLTLEESEVRIPCDFLERTLGKAQWELTQSIFD